MSDLKGYRDFVKSVRTGTAYWKSYTVLQFTLALGRIMRAEKLSGKKLAKKLNVSPAFVSKVLSGGENLTVETMVRFAEALDSSVHIHVAKRGVVVQWVEMPSGQPEAAYYEARQTKKSAKAYVSIAFEGEPWLSTSGQSSVKSTSWTP
jgi:transcriptional regulator with XRE-family HTH domain